MRKRLLALLLCGVLLCAVLPFGTNAASDEEVQRICHQITDIYKKIVRYSGFSNLNGYCGVMAGWELYYLGITDIPLTFNGNEMYDVLKITDRLNEGFERNCYPAEDYTVEEALNAITNGGTKDAYNIMVGFHWTHTYAGSQWGHVNVIHAILDGMVYFTEGFGTPFETNPAKPMICTIQEYAQWYGEWTRFEGLIHFGSGRNLEGYEVYGSNFFGEAKEPTELILHPDQQDFVRKVNAGERLRVIATYRDDRGQTFYKVQESGQVQYVLAEDLTPVLFCYDDVEASDFVLPDKLSLKEDFQITGTVRTQNMIYAVSAEVLDENGEQITGFEIEKNGYMADFNSNKLRKAIDLKQLGEGSYTYNVYCDMVNHYFENGILMGDMQRILLASADFTVGDAQLSVRSEAAQATKTVSQGWQYQNEKWYYFADGFPMKGWYCDGAVDYYFRPDGSAATGWETVNGKLRYFTDTGAMRTGWLTLPDGTYYLRKNGERVTGWYTVEGILYRFDGDGKKVTNTVIREVDKTYILDRYGHVIALPNENET